MALVRRNTIQQNADKLPVFLREAYLSAPIDRFYLDGVEYSGFYDFSYIEEKQYTKEPERTNTGVLNDIESYITFLTPRFTVSYKMMNIEEYRRFINTIKYKNGFTITCYSIDDGKMVTNRMYVAPNSMPKIYTRLLQVEGIQDYTIEFIGTNEDAKTYTLVHDFGTIDGNHIGSTSAEVTRNIPTKIGYDDGARIMYLGKNLVEETLEYDNLVYQFNGWFSAEGFYYVDGDAYYIMDDKEVTAQWTGSGSASVVISNTLTNCTAGVAVFKAGKTGYYYVPITADTGYTLEGATIHVYFDGTEILQNQSDIPTYKFENDILYISGLKNKQTVDNETVYVDVTEISIEITAVEE